MSIRWFNATFTSSYGSGKCGSCETKIKLGDEIAYVNQGDGRILIRRECCEVPPDQVSLFDSLVDSNPNAGSTRRPVMPTGKTAADRCPRCFLIHSKAQGDECE